MGPGTSARFRRRVLPDLKPDQEEEFRKAAGKPAWSSRRSARCNPLSQDEEERKRNIAYCQGGWRWLILWARALCPIAGSLGSKWDGPDPRDLTEHTFALIVDSVRESSMRLTQPDGVLPRTHALDVS